MYFFDRSIVPHPSWFYSYEAGGLNIEIMEYMSLAEKERAQTRIPIVWKEPVPDDVIDALRTISHGKCAFCEEERPDTLPYRFRPPAHALPNDGSLLESANYLWTCWDWNNFYAICQDCVPTEKNLFPLLSGERGQPRPSEFRSYLTNLKTSTFQESNSLPINNLTPFTKEQPLFLSPRKVNDMATYFAASPNGKLYGNDKGGRGEATIRHFNLNRPGLVDRRRVHADQKIESLYEMFRDKDLLKPDFLNSAFDIRTSIYFNFQSSPYATFVYLLLRDIAQKARPDLSNISQISPARIRSFYKRAIEGSEIAKFDKAFQDYFLWDMQGDIAEYEMLQGSKSTPSIDVEGPSPRSKKELERQSCFQNYPRLKSISVKNFKSLEEVTLTLPEKLDQLHTLQTGKTKEQPNAPCLILLGENATGKSSLLEAVCLTSIPDGIRDKLGEKADRIILNPVYMGSGKEANIRRSNVILEFYPSENKKHPVQLSLKIDGNGFTSALNPDDIIRPLIFAYGAHRLFGNVENDTPDLANIITLFKDDQSIRNPEKWLIKQYKKDSNIFDAIVASLRLVIQVDGKFEDISVEDDETGKPYCQINLKRSERILNSVTPDAEDTEKNSYTLPLRFSVASSGYKVILGLLCDIFAGIMAETKCAARDVHTYPAIVLIDEVEAHLHPRWKMQVINGLRKALPKVTFLISSHDPLCVRGSYTGEVAVLNRYTNLASKAKKNTLREAVEVITDLPNLGNFTVDQLLTSDLFSMFSSDDIRTEKTLAIVADKIVELKKDRDNANGDAPLEADELQTRLDAEEKKVFEDFQKNIAEALPIGNDEVARLVQEAVAEFLVKRRNLDSTQERGARKKAKAAIIKHLEAFIS